MSRCLRRLARASLQFSHSQSYSSLRLEPIGVCDKPREDQYETGQLFIHSMFGYRGIVLCAWKANMFDRDVIKPRDSNSKLVNNKPKLYYQVLIDNRDFPFVKPYSQIEGVTFLGEGTNNFLAIPGLDYISHDDVMPYSSDDAKPIDHILFEKFLIHEPDSSPPYIPRQTLKDWQSKNRTWFELSDVYRATTQDIRVTVIPFFMGCKRLPDNSLRYWWRYCIRLENLSDQSVQLIERHWRIFSLNGTLETVRGRGVIGLEPVLSSSASAFQYSSHVSLQAPSGHMWGTYKLRCVKTNKLFDCKIPPFALESKSSENSTTQ